MKNLTILVLSALVLFGLSAGLAQTPAAHETDANVPELGKFHTTIYKLWHVAWPKKDVSMLVTMLPDVQKGAASVAGAALPGILRDKETAWKTGVAKLQERVAEYAAAAKGPDSVALLAAAEKLHAQYEALVRTIRPVMKEVGAFHEVLYTLYHYHVPSFALDSITVQAKLLKERMAIVNGASLPQRLQAKQEAFMTSRTALSAAVDAFGAAVETKDRPGITKAMNTLHNAYQELEKVFD